MKKQKDKSIIKKEDYEKAEIPYNMRIFKKRITIATLVSYILIVALIVSMFYAESETSEQKFETIPHEVTTIKGDVFVKLTHHSMEHSFDTYDDEYWQVVSTDHDAYLETQAGENTAVMEVLTNKKILLSSIIIEGDDDWIYDPELHKLYVSSTKNQLITVTLPGYGSIYIHFN